MKDGDKTYGGGEELCKKENGKPTVLKDKILPL